ncbi:redox-sensing transcriptional repressor Rex [Mycoplasmatota bacterium]|nr:redox-sensing transcriptional repressor Rex [Mycoplasmatota bacterium]
MLQNYVSEAFLERIPLYLNELEKYKNDYISSTTLANILNLGEVLVRKDLAKISQGGKPKIGYHVMDLMNDIKDYMGYNNKSKAIIVGMGRLGNALYHYSGFNKYNIHILEAFDILDDYKNINEIKDFCSEQDIDVGIITVPKDQAQNVCNLLLSQGIKAIWNFAPIRLNVPEDVIVQNENLADSLSILIKHKNDVVRK